MPFRNSFITSFGQEINQTKFYRSKQKHKPVLQANIDVPSAVYFVASNLQHKSGSFPHKQGCQKLNIITWKYREISLYFFV